MAHNRCCNKLAAAHHKLGSQPATPSRLGGFISKSNKCFNKLATQPQVLKLGLMLSLLKCSLSKDFTQPNSRIQL